jgi:hypothetical protein
MAFLFGMGYGQIIQQSQIFRIRFEPSFPVFDAPFVKLGRMAQELPSDQFQNTGELLPFHFKGVIVPIAGRGKN